MKLGMCATFPNKVSAGAMEKSPEFLYFCMMRAVISLGSPSAASPEQFNHLLISQYTENLIAVISDRLLFFCFVVHDLTSSRTVLYFFYSK